MDVEKQLGVLEESSTLIGMAGRKCSAQAQVDWTLYRKSPDGDPDKRTADTKHWAWSLFCKPNHVDTGMEFREIGAQHLMLAAERYWVLGYSPLMPTVPMEMWAIRPDRMTPVRDPYKVLVGWMYRGPDGEDVPLLLREVIQTKIPNPLDPLRGLSPVRTLRSNIATIRAAEDWNARFFANSAEPGGVIQFNERLQQKAWEEFVSRWQQQHRGVNRAHRIAVIENGSYVPRTFTHRDMEFGDLQDKFRDRQLEAYGFPRGMLGITEDVNRANMEAGEYMFSKWVVGTDLKRDRDVLNNKLLTLFPPGLDNEVYEFDYDDPTPTDGEATDRERTSKATSFKTYIDAGASPEWAARVCELPDDVEMREGALENRDAPKVPALPPGQQGGQKALPAGPKRDESNEPDDHALAHVVGSHGRCSHGHRVRNAVEPQPEDDPAAVDEVDLAPVLEATTAAIAALLAAWTAEVVPEWITSLIEQVTRILKSGRRKDLFDMKVPLADATKLIADHMVTRANLAAEEVVREALAQDVSLDAQVPKRAELTEHADATARLLAVQLESVAARSANKRASADTPDEAVIEGVRGDLEALSEATPKRQLGGAIHTAVGQARKATLLSGPTGALYASEQMDARTCDPCEAIHGRWIGNVDPGNSDLLPEVDLLYPAGFYIDCEGWENCRGTIVGVWRPKQGDSAKGRK